jgi:hypothetical protein
MQTMMGEDGVERAVIHYAPKGMLICMGGMHGGAMRTEDPRGVTCRLCRKEKEFLEAIAVAPLIPGRDFFGGL